MSTLSLKIAFIEPNPSFGGGSERVCLDLACGLAKRGHEITLLYRDAGSMLSAYSEFCKVIQLFDLQPFGWRTLKASWQRMLHIASYLKKNCIDLVFCSDLHYLRLLAGVQILSRIPIAFHLGLLANKGKISTYFAYRILSLGIAPSQHVLESWKIAGWVPYRLQLVPNGVDGGCFKLEAGKYEIKIRHGLPHDTKIVLFVGRLVKEKGIGELLKVWGKIETICSDAHLLVVGSTHGDGCVEPWQSLVKEKRYQNVHFIGRIHNPQDYFAAADVTVVPSVWEEPFGLTLIEAMACGSLVLASPRKSFFEITQGAKGVVIVDPENTEKFINMLLQLLNLSVTERQWRGESNREHVIKVYEAEKFINSYENCFLNLARENIAA